MPGAATTATLDGRFVGRRADMRQYVLSSDPSRMCLETFERGGRFAVEYPVFANIKVDH